MQAELEVLGDVRHQFLAELGVCAYCAQFALGFKAYFFRVAQFALRI